MKVLQVILGYPMRCATGSDGHPLLLCRRLSRRRELVGRAAWTGFGRRMRLRSADFLEPRGTARASAVVVGAAR